MPRTLALVPLCSPVRAAAPTQYPLCEQFTWPRCRVDDGELSLDTLLTTQFWVARKKSHKLTARAQTIRDTYNKAHKVYKGYIFLRTAVRVTRASRARARVHDVIVLSRPHQQLPRLCLAQLSLQFEGPNEGL